MAEAAKHDTSVCAIRDCLGGVISMTESAKSEDLCRAEVKISEEHRAKIPDIVNQLVLSCRREDCFNHVGLGVLALLARQSLTSFTGPAASSTPVILSASASMRST